METMYGFFPEWSIVEKLGEGSFGSVYKCRKTEHGVDVYSAIKVIKIPFEEDETIAAEAAETDTQTVREYLKEIVDSCMDEIRMMSSVKGNNNIVSVEDFKCVENESGFGWTIFIRMELLNSFTAYMNKHNFSEKEVLKLGIDICSALQVCEAKQIVHRDIKPANILMTEMGTYKLGDFGIARKLEGSKEGLSSKGTRSYMAPEVSSAGSYGANVDVYSLGIVMYQLLNNNRIPFLDPFAVGVSYTDKKEAVSARLSGKPLPDPCDASPELVSVLRKACEFDPKKRYSSASQMKEDLEDILYARKKDKTTQLDDKTETDDATVLLDDTDVTEINAKSKPVKNKKQNKNGSSKKYITAAALFVVLACGIVCGLFGYIRFAVPGDIVADLRDGEYDRAYSVYEKYYTNTNRSTDRLEEKISDRLDTLETAYTAGRVAYDAAVKETNTVKKMSRVNLDDRIETLQAFFEKEKNINELMTQAQTLYLNGDYVKSIELYEKIIEMKGSNTSAIETALVASENAYRVVVLEEAGYLAANGDKASALAKLDEALLVLPDDLRLLERRNKIEAMEEVTEVATTQPSTTQPSTTQAATQESTTKATQVVTTIVYVNNTPETTKNIQTTTTKKYIDTDNAKIIGTYYVSADTPDHDGVNMRQEPRNSSKLLAELAEGTAVEKTDLEQDGYVYCKYNGQYGWILTEFLTTLQRKTITIKVLDSETRKGIANASIRVYPNIPLPITTALGTTDKNGTDEVAVPVGNITISVSCDGYGEKDTVVDVSGSSQKSVTIYLTSNLPVDDSFTQQYNAALDAYADILLSLDGESHRTACVDVTGDDLPELIVHNSSSRTKTVYSYYTGSVTTLIEENSGKAYSMPIYYNMNKNQVIIISADTGGGKYTVYDLTGNKSKVSQVLEKQNGKFTASGTAEYYVDDELVSEEVYNTALNSLLADFTKVQDAPSQTQSRFYALRK